MGSIVSVTYVLANGEEQAKRLAAAVQAGRVPPMARSLEELRTLRFSHPLPMIGQLIPFAVYTGLASHRSKRLDSGDWAADVERHLRGEKA